MDTARVDICYRPLRIAWAILSSDREAFRTAVRHSHTLCGGRFNPIVLVDADESYDIVQNYRADIVVPVGESNAVKDFVGRHAHLIPPFFPKDIIIGNGDAARSHILDIYNGLAHWREQPDWKSLQEVGLRTFGWAADDPLADVFLMHLGEYPNKDQIGLDYGEALAHATLPHPLIHLTLQKEQPIPLETIRHPSIGYISRHALRRHYSVQPAWDYPGFYVGDASNIRDLVNYWNLVASDIDIRFLDINHVDRYVLIRPEHETLLTSRIANLAEHRRKLAIWSRDELGDQALALFPGDNHVVCRIHQTTWKARSLASPTMILGEESSLGVLGSDVDGQPRISFALKEKPFSSHPWFHTQHLVASLKVFGVPRRGEQFTFSLPNIPQLNEFYARTMIVRYDHLRAEPNRIGLTIGCTDSDASVAAIPNHRLVERLFEQAGIKAELSSGGLIAKQLISRMGGVDGTRAFKIGGVRRLIRTHGPNANFTKGGALQIIGSRDPDQISLPFSAHKRLFIEQRPIDKDLTPSLVFEHLVAKGLFRIGAALVCPTCNLPNWIALDQLRQINICDLCGTQFDATRQLVKSEFSYRRSGVLGLEKNAQGAIPVALLLQQLAVNLSALLRDNLFLTSFDLSPLAGVDLPTCETDFVVILVGDENKATEILIGECKDAGGVIDDTDVENMGKIANALSKAHLNPYIVFAKLNAFTPEEISRAKTLNGPYQRRVILLTAAELEPYHMFEDRPPELKNAYAGNPEGLASITEWLYFR